MSKTRASFESLPPGVKRWLYFERDLLDRDRDLSRLSPDDTNLPDMYLPEAKNIFRLGSYWVPANEVQCFVADAIPNFLTDLFFRSRAGQREALFLVHPAAMQHYAPYFCAGKYTMSSTPFLGVSTSSERTLLVWRQDRPLAPFFAKLSLPYYIGGVLRALSPEVISRCVGVTKILDGSLKNMPTDFGHLRDIYGVAPIHDRTSGFIIREIPHYVISDEQMIIPMFALYSKQMKRRALINRVAKSANLSLRELIRSQISRAFARHWLNLVIDHGIIPEPHAQNLLFQTDPHFRPTNIFVHRDFEGFYVDLRYRKKANHYRPFDLPRVSTISDNYNQKPHKWRSRIIRSIFNFFQGSVLYNFEQFLILYNDTSNQGVSVYSVEREFMEDLSEALYNKTKIQIAPTASRFYSELVDAIFEARLSTSILN